MKELLNDDELNELVKKFGWIVSPESSDMDRAKLVDIKYQFLEVAKAQLAKVYKKTPMSIMTDRELLIEQTLRLERRKISLDITTIIDDNYKDRVKLWAALKAYCKNLDNPQDKVKK